MALRSGIQLAVPFEERRILNQGRFQTRWTPPYIVQPKLNGERCRMLVEDGRCLLLSSSEDIIPAVPHINQAGLALSNGEYDSELYVHGMSWAEIHSIVSRETNIHPDSGKMELHIFDEVNNAPQWYRLQCLNAKLLALGDGPIKRVPLNVAGNLSDLYQLYDKYIEMGYEGFIVREMNSLYERKRIGGMMKFKPKKTDHYLIKGVYEAISEDGKPLEMIGGFYLIDDMGSPFSCGAGKMTHSERRVVWHVWNLDRNVLINRYLEIEYQTMSDKNKVPLFSRAVRIVDLKPECGDE